MGWPFLEDRDPEQPIAARSGLAHEDKHVRACQAAEPFLEGEIGERRRYGAPDLRVDGDFDRPLTAYCLKDFPQVCGVGVDRDAVVLDQEGVLTRSQVRYVGSRLLGPSVRIKAKGKNEDATKNPRL